MKETKQKAGLYIKPRNLHVWKIHADTNKVSNH